MANTHDTQKSNKESESLRIGSAALVGGNTDGKKLYLEVETFDGEHTNRFEPEFPLGTTAKDITDYLKSIIEANPKFPAELSSLMNKKVFYDQTEKAWYTQEGVHKPVKLDDKK